MTARGPASPSGIAARGHDGGGKRIRVLVVDSEPLFRRGVASVLRAADVFEVVGEAGDGPGAFTQVQTLAPDVVLMDVSTADPSAVEAASRITAMAPTVKILALTAAADDGRGVDAMKAGADRYVPRTVDPDELVAAVRAVVRGEPFVTPAMAVTLLDESAGPPVAPFTARERDVLHLLAGGVVNGGIAAHLRVAETAVKNHLRSIVDKLRLQRSAPAGAAAAPGGLGEPRNGASTEAPDESRDAAWGCSARLPLSPADRDLLQQLLRSPIMPERVAVRARIVLGAADGWSNYRIARECATSRPTVLLWRRRYVVHGVRGLLVDAPRPGRPPRGHAPAMADPSIETLSTVPVTVAHRQRNGLRAVPVPLRPHRTSAPAGRA